MTIAYAKRNPLSILTVPDEVSTKLEAVLNLRFTKTTANDSPENKPTNTNGPDEPTKPTDCRDTIDLGHIENDEVRTKILTMLTKHEDMWKTGRLGEIMATEHRITLETGTNPIQSMSYRQGPAMRTRAKAEIRKMRDAGVIEPATSEWASPIVLVPEKDDSLRFCVDYRRLNAKTVPDAYPLPRIDDCLNSLGDAEIFTALDCNAGYWQVPDFDFCQTELTRQSQKTDSAFYEDEYGLLRRRHHTINEIDQIVLPETLRPRVLDLAHYSKLAGHPGQTRMYHHVRSTYYWPQMAADIYRTVRTCNGGAKNRVKLRKRTHPLRLFPAQRPLESLSIDILGPLTKRRKGTGFYSLLRTGLRNLRKLSR